MARVERKAITAAMKINALLDMRLIRCMECGVSICPGEPIDWDHRQALIHDGPHSYTNIRPVHRECHKGKTKRDVQANAKVKRIRGETCTRKGRPLKSRGFDKSLSRKFSGKIERRSP